MSIRTLVVDDEPLARRKLVDALARVDDFEVVAECGGGRAAVEVLRTRPIDLVLLDVHMPDLDGFGVLAEIDGDALPMVIFVTAFDEYAVRAFEVHALDYLLKPFDDERFQSTLDRVRAAGRGAQSARLQALHDAGTTLSLRAGSGSVFVKPHEVLWFEAARNYVYMHTAKQTRLVRHTLTSLETRLAGECFVRIHRSLLVHREAIRAVHPRGAGKYTVHMVDGSVLESGRQYRDVLARIVR